MFEHLALQRVPRGRSPNAIWDAVAGSGKTTSLLEGIKRCDPSWSFLYMSFSRKCITDVKPKLNALRDYNVEAKTFHGVMWAALKYHIGWRNTDKRPEGDKLKRLLRAEMDNAAMRREFGPNVLKLTGLAKQIGLCPTDGVNRDVYPVAEDTPEVWQDLIARYQVDVEPRDFDRTVRWCRNLLRASINKLKTVDFDDMIWAPVMLRVRPRRYNVVMVDEAQDLNPVQRAGCHLFAEQGARMIFVGDPYQSIYGFRGADTQSFQKLADEFEPESYSLPRSYRCPQVVGPLVQPLVPHFEVNESNDPGAIIEMNLEEEGVLQKFKDYQESSLILCRNNAPLVKLAFKFYRARVRCQVLGRDLGASLVNLVEKLDAPDLPTLAERLMKWRDQQVEILEREEKEHLVDGVNDRYATLRVFIDEAKSIESLIPDIERVLLPERGRDEVEEEVRMLTLCTVHKAKGAEAAQVFILNNSLFGESQARAEARGDVEQIQQERNIQYVAYTRTLLQLYFISI